MSVYRPARAISRSRLKRMLPGLLLGSGAYAIGVHSAEQVEFNPAFFAGGATGMHVDVA